MDQNNRPAPPGPRLALAQLHTPLIAVLSLAARRCPGKERSRGTVQGHETGPISSTTTPLLGMGRCGCHQASGMTKLDAKRA